METFPPPNNQKEDWGMKKGWRHKKKRERRRWDGESTTGRAARIASKARKHRSASKRGNYHLRTKNYQGKKKGG